MSGKGTQADWILRALVVVLLATASVGGSAAHAADCNTNGVPDFQDINSGESQDCNTNNRPDECETGLPFGPTFRISESEGEVGYGASRDPALSADGRYIAFYSDAENLGAPGNPNFTDVFVADRVTGGIENVHVTVEGELANDDAIDSIDLTPDGRYVAFCTRADLTGVSSGYIQVYVFDRETDQIDLVSRAPDGMPGNHSSGAPALSADGRYVAFWSVAGNLVDNDTNGATDVFRLDRQTGEMIIASIGLDGAPANSDSVVWPEGGVLYFGSHQIAMTPDARFVAFASFATNLVSGDTNSADVFVRDCVMQVTERVSISSTGEQGDHQSGFPLDHAAGVDITSDGRYVAFESFANNLVPGDPTFNFADLYVHDRHSHCTTRIPTDVLTKKPMVRNPVLTDDGRFVTFQVVVDLPDIWDEGDAPGYLFDRQTGRLERVARNQAGERGNGASPEIWGVYPMTPNGRFVGFSSRSTNLTGNDPTYSNYQIFVRDMLPDCNSNGVPDECDLADGAASDCDGNLIPDECSDCNTNGLADACDLSSDTADDCDTDGLPDECEPDCDTNGVPDACEILGGTALDCSSDGVPDHCESDCDLDGIADPCQSNADCDEDGIVDRCESDCDMNGVADECELMSEISSVTTPYLIIPDNSTVTHSQEITAEAQVVDVEVLIRISHPRPGDLDVYLSHEGQTVELTTDNGGGLGDNFVDTLFDDEGPLSIIEAAAPHTATFRPEGVLSAFDGESAAGTWTLIMTDDESPSSGRLTSWTLSIRTAGSANDCNTNAILDACDPDDCDANGVPEVCEAYWHTDLIESGTVGNFVSVALDNAGFLTAAYYDSAADDLRLWHDANANLVADAEEIQIVDAGGQVGQYASLTFDELGRAAVAYYDSGGENLKYWFDAGGDFAADAGETTIIDSAGSVGTHTSLVFNPQGHAVAAYRYDTGGDLRLWHDANDNAIRDTGEIATIHSVGDVGTYASLAFDAGGLATVAYFHVSNGDLMIWHDANGNYEFNGGERTTIDSDGDVGSHAALAFTPQGHAIVAYYAQDLADLKLWHDADGDFAADAGENVTLDADGDVGKFASLAFEPAVRAMIAYYRADTADLKLWHDLNGDYASDEAEFQVIRPENEAGQHAALLFDPAFFAPLIAYRDVTLGALALAVQLDWDGDEVCLMQDNCRAISNPDQTDSDGDGVGDACEPCPLAPGDLSGDGGVDSDDVSPLVALLLEPGSATPDQLCAADINADGAADGGDIQGFLELLLE